jgi:hypothetical protein
VPPDGRQELAEEDSRFDRVWIARRRLLEVGGRPPPVAVVGHLQPTEHGPGLALVFVEDERASGRVMCQPCRFIG